MSICLSCDWEAERTEPYPGDDFMVKHGWMKGDIWKNVKYNPLSGGFSLDGIEWFVPMPAEPVVAPPPPVIEPKPWDLEPKKWRTVQTMFGAHHVLKEEKTEIDGVIEMLEEVLAAAKKLRG